MSYWDDVRDSGLFGYGYGKKKFKDVTANEHFQRARGFVFGQGAGKTEMLNSIGIITNAQRNLAQNSKMAKFMTAGIPLFSAFMAYDAAKNGEQVPDYLASNVALHSGGFYGARLGANIGAGIDKGLRGSGWAGRVYGGAIGGIAGAALAYGAVEGVLSLGQANNGIQTVAKKMYDPDLNRNIIQNRNTLTHREAALAAISKSAMNNRGQMMGREAQILYGS